MAVSWMLWVLIVFNGLMMLGVLVFGVMFVYRKRTSLIVYMPDKTVVSKNMYGSLGKTQVIGDCEYFIDDTCMIRKFFGFELHYFYGNPNPILYDFSRNNPEVVGTKAQDLKTFHESDLIKKLFSLDSLENFILYLVIGVAILNLIIIAILLFKPSNAPVTLASNANNTQIIASAVRRALFNMSQGVGV